MFWWLLLLLGLWFLALSVMLAITTLIDHCQHNAICMGFDLDTLRFLDRFAPPVFILMIVIIAFYIPQGQQEDSADAIAHQD